MLDTNPFENLEMRSKLPFKRHICMISFRVQIELRLKNTVPQQTQGRSTDSIKRFQPGTTANTLR
jgi:hypothetical protein